MATVLTPLSGLPAVGTITDADILPLVDLTKPAGLRTRQTTAGAFAAYVAAKIPPSSGGSGGGSALPTIVFDVRQYGAQGIGSSFHDETFLQAAINAAAVLGGAVYIPRAPSFWNCDSGLNLTGFSNVTLFGDPGLVSIIKATASLNGSNNGNKNDLIYALNFSGQAGSNGYPQSNIVVQDLVLDCTLQSASGVVVDGNYGRSLAAFENLNVDYCKVRRVRVIGAFGNGIVHGTADPRLYNDAGLPNGLRRPIIEDVEFINCCRGLLPQYANTVPGGIAGDCMQIGSCHGGSIKGIYALNPGGPLIDFFNCDGLTIEDVYVEGFGTGPTGCSKTNAGGIYQQLIGGIHSDFGAINCTIRRYTAKGCGGILLNGQMTNTGFFNGYTRTPGPQYCTIDDVYLYQPFGKVQVAAPTFTSSGQTFTNSTYTSPVLIQFIGSLSGFSYQYRRGTDGAFGTAQNSSALGIAQTIVLYPGDAIVISYSTAPTWVWYLSPNIGFPGISLTGGSIIAVVVSTPTAFIGNAYKCKLSKITIIQPGCEGVQIYDGARCTMDDVYVENPGASVPSLAVSFLTQIAMTGSGSHDNLIDKLQVYDDRTPKVLPYNVGDDTASCTNNRLTNSRLESYTVASVRVNGSLSQANNYGPGFP